MFVVVCHLHNKVNFSLILYVYFCILVRLYNEKRSYTRETLRGIRILRLAKINTLYRDLLRSLN